MIEVLAEADREERHYRRLKELLSSANGIIRIATAYLTERELLSRRQTHEVRLLVSDSLVDIARGAISLDALAGLLRAGVSGRFSPPSPRLHAKVYIFGEDTAIVSSANFTYAALRNNIEVGVEISGTEVRKLVAWYDQIWTQCKKITPQRLRELHRQTTDLRRRYANLEKELNRIELPPIQHSPPSQGGRGVDALFATAQRFFVCNTDRKDGEPSPGGGFLREEMMAQRGFAAAWEDFRFPTHMHEVRQGHAIFAYAKGAGIIGVGRSKGACEQLRPGDPHRLHPGDSIEWRIPVDWLDWRDDDHACPWPSYNATFWEVSADRYAEVRTNVRHHFLRTST